MSGKVKQEVNSNEISLEELREKRLEFYSN